MECKINSNVQQDYKLYYTLKWRELILLLFLNHWLILQKRVCFLVKKFLMSLSMEQWQMETPRVA
ncbi:hypothetical protein ACOSP7_007261 [Xanthoceras sorbifolium]